MIRKSVVASALAGVLALGAAGPATAEPRAQVWLPVFYLGTQTHCTQAGLLAQQMGVLTAGRWKCDSGWLMALSPN